MRLSSKYLLHHKNLPTKAGGFFCINAAGWHKDEILAIHAQQITEDITQASKSFLKPITTKIFSQNHNDDV